MTRTHRFAFVAALMVAPPVLMAQEPVDTSFKLVAASVGDQEKAGLGQDRQYGLTIAGDYPMTRRGAICLEGGWQYSPSSSREVGINRLEDRRDLYHLGVIYRQGVLLDGFSVQGGLRFTSSVVTTRTYLGATTWVRDHGPRHGAFAPVLGLHARLTDKLSVEINGTRLATKDRAQVVRTASVLEVALGVHFGK